MTLVGNFHHKFERAITGFKGALQVVKGHRSMFETLSQSLKGQHTIWGLITGFEELSQVLPVYHRF